MESWTEQCPSNGQLGRALSIQWTVGQRTVHPMDSWAEHCPSDGQLDCPSDGQLDRALSHPIDSWTEHCTSNGHLGRALSIQWTVGESTVHPIDSWTEHCPSNGQLGRWTVGHSIVHPRRTYGHFLIPRSLNPICPSEVNLSVILDDADDEFFRPWLF